MNYNFFSPYGDEKDQQILNAFKNKQSLPGISYLVICHKPGKWWDKKKKFNRPYLRRKFAYSNELYWGPMFYDEDGNEYEIYLSKLWNDQKLSEKQKLKIEAAFQEVVSQSIDEVFHKIYWQPLRDSK